MNNPERLPEIRRQQNDRVAHDHRQRRGSEQAAARRIDMHPDGAEASKVGGDDRRRSAEDAARLRIEGEAKSSDVPRRMETESREQAEHGRVTRTVEALRGNDWLQPEHWRGLNEYERRAALVSAGRVLRDSYGCADAPVIPKDFAEYSGGTLLGFYADGASKDSPTGDYELAVNNKLMASDDPRQTLETYLHEFRHAYQHEMAARFDKPQFEGLVHDPDLAAEWSRNFRGNNYKEGPPPEMPAEHPDYRRLFEEYENQPVERDAREFAQRLLREIYRV